MSPSKLRRVRRHKARMAAFNRIKNKVLSVYLEAFPTVIRGKKLNMRSPYYAKPKPYDLPDKVLVWSDGLRVVGDRQVKTTRLVNKVLQPYRIGYGDIGKSRHSKYEFQQKDARKHVLTVLKPGKPALYHKIRLMDGTIVNTEHVKREAVPTTYHDSSNCEPHSSECIIKGLAR
jgi:hypothetical protein